MFRLMRYFSVACLLSIMVTALGLGLLYRQAAMDGILELGRTNSVAIAQTALNAMRDDLLDYLNSVHHLGARVSTPPPLPERLQHEISQLLDHNIGLVRLCFYNRQGLVVFSTKAEQIGADQRDNVGFVAAMNGNISTDFVYRDTFNRYERVTEDDNLIHTYLPVGQSRTSAPEGVFEIYTDMNPLVKVIERTEIIVMGGGFVILLCLYGVLLLVVGRAKSIIDAQHETILERTRTLELLSAQMLRNQEREKQKLATELHEGVAQTLSAIKISVENASKPAPDSPPGASSQSLAAVVPAIQDAIHEVRSISTGLRPPSLDDFGIVATLSWLCREFESVYPDMRIEAQFEAREEEIPHPLKITIYRITQAGLTRIAKVGGAARVKLGLMLRDGYVTLMIDNQAREPALQQDGVASGAQTESELATMEERTVLSGGRFSTSGNEWGGISLQASWMP